MILFLYSTPKTKKKSYIANLDVRDNANVEKFAKEIPNEFKEIDILVNNAGLALGFEQSAENKLVITQNKNLFFDVILTFFLQGRYSQYD